MRRLGTHPQTTPRRKSSFLLSYGPVHLCKFPDALSPSGLPLHKSIPLISLYYHFLYSLTKFLRTHPIGHSNCGVARGGGIPIGNSLMTAVVTPAKVHLYCSCAFLESVVCAAYPASSIPRPSRHVLHPPHPTSNTAAQIYVAAPATHVVYASRISHEHRTVPVTGPRRHTSLGLSSTGIPLL